MLDIEIEKINAYDALVLREGRIWISISRRQLDG